MDKLTSKTLLSKIVVNSGVGKISTQANFEDKILPQIVSDISSITGQKPKLTRAKKSIAGFKSREGQIVGVVVTLRGQKMVDFFERLITIVLPRVHDFKGLSIHTVDDHGSLHVGFREQAVFPELNAEESHYSFSFGVSIVPKSGKKAEIIEAYKKLGVPFAKKEEAKKSKGRKRRKKNK